MSKAVVRNSISTNTDGLLSANNFRPAVKERTEKFGTQHTRDRMLTRVHFCTL